MVDQDLKKIMDDEWKKVRKGFHYPQLPHPQLVDDIPNGSMDMVSLETKVSEPFIREFELQGISPSEAMNEVLTHEVTHFMHYPGSVLNILRLQRAAKGVVEGDRASALRAHFNEAQVNLFMVEEKKHPTTAKMRRSYHPEQLDPEGRIMYGIYQERSGQDFGVQLDEKETDLVKKLAKIDFTSKANEVSNFRRFVDIMKDYNPSQKQGSGSGKGNGSSKGSKGDSNGKASMFTKDQIQEGLRQFARECTNPEEFEEVARQVLGENKDYKKAFERPESQAALTPGTDQGTLQLARNFYSALASNYALPIQKKPLQKSGTLYPYSRAEFSTGDPLLSIDPFSAPGILPGITKKIIRREGHVHGDLEHVPNSLIMIDNSPSMFASPGSDKVLPPSERIYPHIVGSTAVANVYLDNGANVAVYSFGSNDQLSNFSRSRENIHADLRRFSVDGGTTFTPSVLEGILQQHTGTFDVSVVSDMAISNLDGFVNSVLGLPNAHRVHLFYTSRNPYVNVLKDKFKDKSNVGILPLVTLQDIYAITMGELKKSVH